MISVEVIYSDLR